MYILNIPIEPLEERYSIQWDKWFYHAFRKAGLRFDTIYGTETSGNIRSGSFLDVIETNKYKTSQLQKIIDILSFNGDREPLILFFHDLWDPGLSTIAYIRDGMGFKNVYITGCLHAGSYDENDFLNKQKMTLWADKMEDAWFGKIVDRIYVATHYHKGLLCSKRNVPEEKVIVTGFPIYKETDLPSEKKNIIVFPHRLDSEKQPELFDMLHEELRDESELLGWKWVRTKDVCINKIEYYELLNKAKIAISFAKQETWGIAMQEAVLYGCIPIVPNRLSYVELYDRVFRYDTLEGAKNMIIQFMTRPPMLTYSSLKNSILVKGEGAISEIIRNLQNIAYEKN